MNHLWELRRDFLIAFRSKSELINPVAFFVLVTVFFALGSGAIFDSNTAAIASGCIWVIALFANMLALESMFRADFESGAIDTVLMHQNPLFVAVLQRMFVSWLLTGLPICLLSLWSAWMFQLPMQHWGVLLATLSLGTPILTAVGSLGAAFTVGLPRGGITLALIVMPLYVPVLLLGTGICHSHINGEATNVAFLWLISLLAFTITFSPFAVSKVLQASVEY